MKRIGIGLLVYFAVQSECVFGATERLDPVLQTCVLRDVKFEPYYPVLSGRRHANALDALRQPFGGVSQSSREIVIATIEADGYLVDLVEIKGGWGRTAWKTGLVVGDTYSYSMRNRNVVTLRVQTGVKKDGSPDIKKVDMRIRRLERIDKGAVKEVVPVK